MYANLPEDSCIDINHRSNHSFNWSNNQWNNGICPQKNDFSKWPIDPDMNKGTGPIDECEDNGKGKPEDEDKEVIDEELSVFVCQLNHFVEGVNRLGALMLVETLLEFQLGRETTIIIYSCICLLALVTSVCKLIARLMHPNYNLHGGVLLSETHIKVRDRYGGGV